MSFHLAAYFGNLAAGAVFLDVPAIADPVLTRQNNHYLPQADWQLIMAYGGGVDLSHMRLASPTIRQIGLPNFQPLTNAVIPTANFEYVDYRRDPLRIFALEELQVEAFHDNVGAQDVLGLLSLQDRLEAPSRNDPYTIRATGANTATTNAWTESQLTFDDALPNGVYQVTGMVLIGTNVAAGRLIFEDQKIRPGVPAFSDFQGTRQTPWQKGGMGVWGTFRQTALPQLEVFATGAGSAIEIFVDIVRIQ